MLLSVFNCQTYETARATNWSQQNVLVSYSLLSWRRYIVSEAVKSGQRVWEKKKKKKERSEGRRPWVEREKHGGEEKIDRLSRFKSLFSIASRPSFCCCRGHSFTASIKPKVHLNVGRAILLSKSGAGSPPRLCLPYPTIFFFFFPPSALWRLWHLSSCSAAQRGLMTDWEWLKHGGGGVAGKKKNVEKYKQH